MSVQSLLFREMKMWVFMTLCTAKNILSDSQGLILLFSITLAGGILRSGNILYEKMPLRNKGDPTFSRS